MNQDAGSRWIAFAGAASLHIAVGLALVSAAASGAPLRDSSTNGPGRTILVDISSFESPGEIGKVEASGAASKSEPIQAEGNDTGPQAPAPFAASQSAGASGEGGATLAQASTAPAADLPDAEVLAYKARLQAHLSRYRIYPSGARGAGQQGVVVLHFVMGRDGEVIDAWVEASSGAETIDQEAVAAVMRAQPLPAFPTGWPAQLGISLPVTFRLG